VSDEFADERRAEAAELRELAGDLQKQLVKLRREAVRIETGNGFVSAVFRDMDALVRAEQKAIHGFISAQPKIGKNVIAQTLIALRNRFEEIEKERRDLVDLAAQIRAENEVLKVGKPVKPLKLSELDESVHLRFLELEQSRMELRQGIEQLGFGTKELVGLEARARGRLGKLRKIMGEGGEPDLMLVRIEIENARLRNVVRDLELRIGERDAGQSSRSMRV
jgi:hypothetical protein